ncbi:MAG: 7,8-dihydroneopterin 2,3-cyclic phosphate phosphodiesterase [Thermoproteota archaeon]|nr:7,8-dihydroneopterin 2,3-cyclic phosphate phosphodiesterase [Thermoproteota archaeon]
MRKELKNLVDKIKDQRLRKKVVDVIENPTIKIEKIKYKGLSLEATPAGKTRHHAYSEGLIQHMIASSTIALSLCDIVEKVYHGRVNRDIVLASTLVHDSMKPLTYAVEENGSFEVSPLGEKMDHLTLIVSELIRRDFSLDVIHAVTAHHGRAGPISPRTIEALICFLADSTDATLNGETLNAARFLMRDCLREEAGQLTAEQAFAIVYAKQTKGCEGVKEEFKRIRNKE